jgi:hypothetical protein
MKNILRKPNEFPWDVPTYVSHSVIPNNWKQPQIVPCVKYIPQHGKVPAWGAETLHFNTETK